MENYKIEVSVEISASKEKIWRVLTEPKLIKEYMFGTDTITDWIPGNSIKWSGKWDNIEYNDKGIVKRVIINELLEYTYWSSMSKLPDIKENYKTITCKLKEIDANHTKLTIIQDNNKTKESKEHSEQNWKSVGNKIKEISQSI